MIASNTHADRWRETALRNLTNLPQGGKVVTPGHGTNAVTAMRDPERNAKDFILIPSSSLPLLSAVPVARGERMRILPDPG